jgi:hypothetical protein
MDPSTTCFNTVRTAPRPDKNTFQEQDTPRQRTAAFTGQFIVWKKRETRAISMTHPRKTLFS